MFTQNFYLQKFRNSVINIKTKRYICLHLLIQIQQPYFIPSQFFISILFICFLIFVKLEYINKKKYIYFLLQLNVFNRKDLKKKKNINNYLLINKTTKKKVL